MKNSVALINMVHTMAVKEGGLQLNKLTTVNVGKNHV